MANEPIKKPQINKFKPADLWPLDPLNEKILFYAQYINSLFENNINRNILFG